MPPIPDHRLGSLAGRLLLATPLLRDPNFNRTVILIVEHQPGEGALGIILNRPLEVPLHTVLPEWAPRAAPPAQLFEGGPVGRDTAIALARYTHRTPPPEGFTPIPRPTHRGPATHVGLLDVGRHPTALPGVQDVRLYHGHAGWAPGQLELEIHHDSWFVLDPAPSDPLTDNPHHLWTRILQRQPQHLAIYATHPEEPAPTWN